MGPSRPSVENDNYIPVSIQHSLTLRFFYPKRLSALMGRERAISLCHKCSLSSGRKFDRQSYVHKSTWKFNRLVWAWVASRLGEMVRGKRGRTELYRKLFKYLWLPDQQAPVGSWILFTQGVVVLHLVSVSATAQMSILSPRPKKLVRVLLFLQYLLTALRDLVSKLSNQTERRSRSYYIFDVRKCWNQAHIYSSLKMGEFLKTSKRLTREILKACSQMIFLKRGWNY